MTASSPDHRQTRSMFRKLAILDAALTCFSERGIVETSIGEICKRSGSTVGSVYHLFANKSGVVAALYLDTLTQYQAAIVQKLRTASNAKDGLVAIISAHIDWVENNPHHALFLQQARYEPAVATHSGDIQAMNRVFGLAIATWVKPHIDTGQLRPMPTDIFISVLLGPLSEHTKGRLSGRQSASSKVAKKLLSESAWRALGGDSEVDESNSGEFA